MKLKLLKSFKVLLLLLIAAICMQIPLLLFDVELQLICNILGIAIALLILLLLIYLLLVEVFKVKIK